jgi:pyruvate/2-oxoglutarate dehydrogenase complex dihydrolipoamide dehydrogenase (E3) component
MPPIPGLTAVPYLTNETIFALNERPRRLAVIGAGRLAASWRRRSRGSARVVTLIDQAAAGAAAGGS